MQTKFDTPGPFSVTFCLAQQALSGQRGVVESPAPHPPCSSTLSPDVCGETQAGIQAAGVCSLGPQVVVLVFMGSGGLGMECLLSFHQVKHQTGQSQCQSPQLPDVHV